MSEKIGAFLQVRAGFVNGIAVDREADIAEEWLADPLTEMIVRIDLEIARTMLFKSKEELLQAMEKAL